MVTGTVAFLCFLITHLFFKKYLENVMEWEEKYPYSTRLIRSQFKKKAKKKTNPFYKR